MTLVRAKVEIVPVNFIRQAMRKLTKSTERRTEEASYAAAVRIYQLSQVYVPVKTGFLKSTGRVEKEGKGFQRVCLVVYETPYAGYVHENLTAYHAPPTQAKYLETAARAYQYETFTVETGLILPEGGTETMEGGLI